MCLSESLKIFPLTVPGLKALLGGHLFRTEKAKDHCLLHQQYCYPLINSEPGKKKKITSLHNMKNKHNKRGRASLYLTSSNRKQKML